MHKLVLLRHGESQWNQETALLVGTMSTSPKKGRAKPAIGQLLKEAGFQFDVAYTSVLKRAIRTLWFALLSSIRFGFQHREWRLNYFHYGGLQGLNKVETVEKHGDDQVLVWRRLRYPPQPCPRTTKAMRERPPLCQPRRIGYSLDRVS